MRVDYKRCAMIAYVSASQSSARFSQPLWSALLEGASVRVGESATKNASDANSISAMPLYRFTVSFAASESGSYEASEMQFGCDREYDMGMWVTALRRIAGRGRRASINSLSKSDVDKLIQKSEEEEEEDGDDGDEKDVESDDDDDDGEKMQSIAGISSAQQNSKYLKSTRGAGKHKDPTTEELDSNVETPKPDAQPLVVPVHGSARRKRRSSVLKRSNGYVLLLERSRRLLAFRRKAWRQRYLVVDAQQNALCAYKHPADAQPLFSWPLAGCRLAYGQEKKLSVFQFQIMFAATSSSGKRPAPATIRAPTKIQFYEWVDTIAERSSSSAAFASSGGKEKMYMEPLSRMASEARRAATMALSSECDPADKASLDYIAKSGRACFFYAGGNGVKAALEGKETTFHVYTSNAEFVSSSDFNGDFSAELVQRTGSGEEERIPLSLAAAEIEGRANRSDPFPIFAASYTPTFSGSCSLSISYDGYPIFGSPYAVDVMTPVSNSSTNKTSDAADADAAPLAAPLSAAAAQTTEFNAAIEKQWGHLRRKSVAVDDTPLPPPWEPVENVVACLGAKSSSLVAALRPLMQSLIQAKAESAAAWSAWKQILRVWPGIGNASESYLKTLSRSIMESPLESRDRICRLIDDILHLKADIRGRSALAPPRPRVAVASKILMPFEIPTFIADGRNGSVPPPPPPLLMPMPQEQQEMHPSPPSPPSPPVQPSTSMPLPLSLNGLVEVDVEDVRDTEGDDAALPARKLLARQARKSMRPSWDNSKRVAAKSENSGAEMLGKRVRLVDGRECMVRFAGATQFAPGYWIGVEFDENSASGKNDGSVFGVRYFSCSSTQPKGLFVRPNKVESAIDSGAQTARTRVDGSASSRQTVSASPATRSVAIEKLRQRVSARKLKAPLVAARRSSSEDSKTSNESEGVPLQNDNPARAASIARDLDAIAKNEEASPSSVEAWVRTLGIDDSVLEKEILAAFKKHNVGTLKKASLLNKSDLEAMGLRTLNARLRILSACSLLSEQFEVQERALAGTGPSPVQKNRRRSSARRASLFSSLVQEYATPIKTPVRIRTPSARNASLESAKSHDSAKSTKSVTFSDAAVKRPKRKPPSRPQRKPPRPPHAGV